MNRALTLTIALAVAVGVVVACDLWAQFATETSPTSAETDRSMPGCLSCGLYYLGKCGDCDGAGTRSCGWCGGDGIRGEKQCTYCTGRGKLKCIKCNGTGKTQ